jgi:lipopolysaccharide export system protein LptC
VDDALSHVSGPVPVRGAPKVALRHGSSIHRASAYSRFVSLMKVFLPVLAVMLIGLVVVWPYLQGKESRFRIGFSGLMLTGSEDPNMVNARYQGTDRNSRMYSITADLARNLLDGTSAVELEMPKADMVLEDGTWLVLTADTGIYTRDTATLELAGAVTLFHDSGYEFRTSKAFINLTDGLAESTEPVEGQGPFGFLKAEGFRLIDKGKIIQFTGKAKVTIYPGANKR